MNLQLLYSELNRYRDKKGTYFFNNGNIVFDIGFLKVGCFISVDKKYVAIVKYLYGKIIVKEL